MSEYLRGPGPTPAAEKSIASAREAIEANRYRDAEHRLRDWPARRCSPENPCQRPDAAHVVLWGECFHLVEYGPPLPG